MDLTFQDSLGAGRVVNCGDRKGGNSPFDRAEFTVARPAGNGHEWHFSVQRAAADGLLLGVKLITQQSGHCTVSENTISPDSFSANVATIAKQNDVNAADWSPEQAFATHSDGECTTSAII